MNARNEKKYLKKDNENDTSLICDIFYNSNHRTFTLDNADFMHVGMWVFYDQLPTCIFI